MSVVGPLRTRVGARNTLLRGLITRRHAEESYRVVTCEISVGGSSAGKVGDTGVGEVSRPMPSVQVIKRAVQVLLDAGVEAQQELKDVALDSAQ